MSMARVIRGRCWRFGDDVNTDVIFPQRYSHVTDPREIARHAMEGIDPDFSERVKQGDIVVAGSNFGCGSSMEHAPIALRESGVGAVVAESFARIFYRNAISLGLPVVELEETGDFMQGDILEISLEAGELRNATRGSVQVFRPLPGFLMDVLQAGGLISHLNEKLAKRERRAKPS
jgi:3-isopropylmalate/(R)-2-methylmalate dehydratase small subunit